MAGGAGRHALGGDAATVDLLAFLDRVLVLGGGRLDRLLGKVGANVTHFVVSQHRCHRHHDRVVACLGLEVGQLLVDVFRMLGGQLGIGGGRAVAGGAMAAQAGGHIAIGGALGVQRLTLGRVGLRGGLLCGRCQSGKGGCRNGQCQDTQNLRNAVHSHTFSELFWIP
ncbi:hypothetical protein D9M68_659390 [compost metagenome]